MSGAPFGLSHSAVCLRLTCLCRSLLDIAPNVSTQGSHGTKRPQGLHHLLGKSPTFSTALGDASPLAVLFQDFFYRSTQHYLLQQFHSGSQEEKKITRDPTAVKDLDEAAWAIGKRPDRGAEIPLSRPSLWSGGTKELLKTATADYHLYLNRLSAFFPPASSAPKESPRTSVHQHHHRCPLCHESDFPEPTLDAHLRGRRHREDLRRRVRRLCPACGGQEAGRSPAEAAAHCATMHRRPYPKLRAIFECPVDGCGAAYSSAEVRIQHIPVQVQA